ncbi:hypothetical protein LLEC1_04592 [Akanthomyces lecanii]|uniref:Potassium transport protein n=1 Tax=Cordyceps confragosa TaxID=2714763 RepID=A0A179I9T0_CORDF|nr:hypothetical protein LLEC1_04592 [Akanthomyces lecanii]
MGTLASMRHRLPAELNFITMHYCYFVVVCLLASGVFWASNDPRGRVVGYVDGLFVVVSAMTEAGLNTVELSAMTTWQQAMLLLLIVAGSTIWVSIWTVVARRFVFYRRLVRAQRRCRLETCSAGRQSVRQAAGTGREAATEHQGASCAQSTLPDENTAEEEEQTRPWINDSPCSLNREPTNLETGEDGLADQRSRRVCGCEYRALELLSVVGAYFVLVTMGLMILAGNTAYPIFLRFILWSGGKVLDWTTEPTTFQGTKLAVELLLRDPRRVYTNLFPSRLTWWLLFMLVCLNTADWVLFEVLNLHNPVVGSIPVGPRVPVGLFQALAVRSGGFYVVPIAQISIGVQFLYVIMMYIAVYPVVITMRQSNVYTEDLFSNKLATEMHDMPQQGNLPHSSEKGNLATGHETQPTSSAPTEQTAWRRRLSHSATATTDAEPMRLHTASQSNGRPHEKRPSFHTRPFSSQGTTPHATYDSHISFIHQQLHGQLAHDIWLLVLAVLVIVIIESSHFNADPVNFSVFNIIFEVVSAYGTVGISVGTPTAAYSFAGTWYAGSKLVLCLVMLRGRHRGLPTALDHAIRLPGHDLNCKQCNVKDK